MKCETLRKLYHGEISPFDKYAVLIDGHKGRDDKLYQSSEAFIDRLSIPMQEEFEQIIDMYMEKLPYEYEQAFIDGFRLGVKIMIETLK